MISWMGQYCINVSDLDRTVALYEALGLECTSRTSIDEAEEAIIERRGKGGQLQVAQQRNQTGPIDMGTAFWKLYVNTTDVHGLYRAALDNNCEPVSAPERAQRWPVTIAFVKDPDGYLVEFVERHPWTDGDTTTPSWIGQYCLNVSDIEATVGFYELLGLLCTSRTDIVTAKEAIIENTARGGKLQLAQQIGDGSPIEMGTAMWKLYVHTDDCEGLHSAAVAAGHPSIMEPQRLARWPVTIAFVGDPDGYQVEIVQRDPPSST